LTVYLLCKSSRNLVLFCFSLIFYAWGEPIYILLMLLSILFNYGCAQLIGNADAAGKEKTYFVVGIIGNLALLFFFKYFPFVIQQLQGIVPFQIPLSSSLGNLPLPLGISFFTFQAMSYLFDVHRKHVPYEKSFLTVATYITMFPQLVAGPIVRYERVARELTSRTLTYDGFMTGMKIFILGLASKVVLANRFAIYADDVFSHDPMHLSIAVSWLGIICYTFQIYFDFAGYSTMAIGLGKMLGFDFPLNFNVPYTATSVTDFWRRWHISLSTWFRDYLYIPLGGNRAGKFKTYRNLMLVFILCGLWHGASWNFLIWGIYYGFFLIVERFFRNHDMPVYKPLRHLYLILVVMVGWVFFRSPDLPYALNYMQVMFGLTAGKQFYTAQMYPLSLIAVLVTVGTIASICKREDFNRVFETASNVPLVTKSLKYSAYILLFAVCTFLLVVSRHNPFIYFRF
jgi:alginate O-acetyltransferase complex protein AlgI